MLGQGWVRPLRRHGFGEYPGTVRAQSERGGLTTLPGISRVTRRCIPIVLVMVTFLAANIVAAYHRRTLSRDRAANLLKLSGRRSKPRFDMSYGEDTARFWPFIQDGRRHPLVIVSGMSQMHAINSEKPGDEIIAELLDDYLSSRGIRVFGLAAPNLDNEEALLYLIATCASPRTKPAVFIYGICFDKFRNVEVRPGLERLLTSSPAISGLWLDVARRVEHP